MKSALGTQSQNQGLEILEAGGDGTQALGSIIPPPVNAAELLDVVLGELRQIALVKQEVVPEGHLGVVVVVVVGVCVSDEG